MRREIEATKPSAETVVKDIRRVTRKQAAACRHDPGPDNAWRAVSSDPASPLPNQWLRRSLLRLGR